MTNQPNPDDSGREGPSAEPVFQLVYFSRCQVAGRPEDIADAIRDILSSSRTHNPRLAVTGALLFNGVHFAQVLEGPIANLLSLLRRIQLDSRHSNITIVQEEWLAARDFGHWAMGYVDDDWEHAIRLSPTVDFVGVPDTAHGQSVLDLLRYLVRESSGKF